MLTSLKVLRISENFLPPLISSNTAIFNTENISRINLISSTSASTK